MFLQGWMICTELKLHSDILSSTLERRSSYPQDTATVSSMLPWEFLKLIREAMWWQVQCRHSLGIMLLFFRMLLLISLCVCVCVSKASFPAYSNEGGSFSVILLYPSNHACFRQEKELWLRFLIRVYQSTLKGQPTRKLQVFGIQIFSLRSKYKYEIEASWNGWEQ